MYANQKVFRHSFGKLALMFLGVLVFGFLAISSPETDYFLFFLAGLSLVIALFFATSSVRISSEGITTTRLFSSKTMTWPEIGRVSARGQAIRLHDRDETMTLSLDSQLDGYSEILDLVFSKRPDLIDNRENNTLSASWWRTGITVGMGVLFAAISFLLFFTVEGFDRVYSLILFGVGILLVGSWFLSPQSIALEDRNLLIKYLYKEVTYSSEDIKAVSLEKRQTRNGTLYFPQITLRSGKKIKLPAFQQGAALTYQILKRWHEKATVSRTSYAV